MHPHRRFQGVQAHPPMALRWQRALTAASSPPGPSSLPLLPSSLALPLAAFMHLHLMAAWVSHSTEGSTLNSARSSSLQQQASRLYNPAAPR